MRTRIPGRAIAMIFGVPLGLALLVVLANPSRNPNDQPSPQIGSASLSIGQEARLHRINGQQDPATFLVAADYDAFKEEIAASVASDIHGLQNLIKAGRLWIVPAGTRVLVLDLAFTSRQVRILEGEHTGKAGWIESEFVGP